MLGRKIHEAVDKCIQLAEVNGHSHFIVWWKVTQHCKAAITQFRKKRKFYKHFRKQFGLIEKIKDVQTI